MSLQITFFYNALTGWKGGALPTPLSCDVVLPLQRYRRLRTHGLSASVVYAFKMPGCLLLREILPIEERRTRTPF